MVRNTRRAKWRDLLEDDDVRRWFENLARVSELTAVDRARVLHRYLKAHRTTAHTARGGHRHVLLRAAHRRVDEADLLHRAVGVDRCNRVPCE